MEGFYDMCQEVHMGILKALEQGFRARGVKVDLVERCRENVSEMRLNYYPEIVSRDEQARRRHTLHKPRTTALLPTPRSHTAGTALCRSASRPPLQHLNPTSTLFAEATITYTPPDSTAPIQVSAEESQRLIPPLQDIPSLRTGRMSRISEHTDFGTVTLLFQDSVGGLEVESQTQPGHYIPVEASSASEILVNIGDSLQRLTNDVLTSVSHRVTVPVSEQDRENGVLAPRYSVAYFAKVARHVSLKPMAEFVDEVAGRPAKYPDMTAFEWNQIKLQKIYG